MVNIGAMCSLCFPPASLKDIQRCHDLMDEAAALQSEGRAEEAEACLEEALGKAMDCEPKYHYGVALAQNLLSKLQMEMNMWRKAETTLTAFGKNCNSVKDIPMECCVYSRLSVVQVVLKQTGAAVASLKHVIELAQELCDIDEELAGRINLCFILIIRKQVADVRTQLDILVSGKAENAPEILAQVQWVTALIKALDGADFTESLDNFLAAVTTPPWLALYMKYTKSKKQSDLVRALEVANTPCSVVTVASALAASGGDKPSWAWEVPQLDADFICEMLLDSADVTRHHFSDKESADVSKIASWLEQTELASPTIVRSKLSKK